jgi:hypothetical protein
MLRSVVLQFGRGPDSAPCSIGVTPVTIFVGPNNAGKSKILRELRDFFLDAQHHSEGTILKSVEFSPVDGEEVARIVESCEPVLNRQSYPFPDPVFFKRDGGDSGWVISRPNLLEVLSDPNANKHAFINYCLEGRVIYLDAATRTSLLNRRDGGNLQVAATNTLQRLFRNRSAREEIRRITFEAFGSYFVVDPTNLGSFQVRMSDVLPESEIEECGIHSASVLFHAAARPIEGESDGVKSYTGIVAEILASRPKIIAIDEPEAFLHPSIHRIFAWARNCDSHSGCWWITVCGHP